MDYPLILVCILIAGILTMFVTIFSWSKLGAALFWGSAVLSTIIALIMILMSIIEIYK